MSLPWVVSGVPSPRGRRHGSRARARLIRARARGRTLAFARAAFDDRAGARQLRTRRGATAASSRTTAPAASSHSEVEREAHAERVHGAARLEQQRVAGGQVVEAGEPAPAGAPGASRRAASRRPRARAARAAASADAASCRARERPGRTRRMPRARWREKVDSRCGRKELHDCVQTMHGLNVDGCSIARGPESRTSSVTKLRRNTLQLQEFCESSAASAQDSPVLASLLVRPEARQARSRGCRLWRYHSPPTGPHDVCAELTTS